MDLSGKTVFLTGASRGIGRALAMELAKYGSRLILTAVEADELIAVTSELKKITAHVSSYAADLADSTERAKLIDRILQAPYPIDILINNAGIGGHFGRFISQDWTETEKIIHLNIIASIHLTRELLPILRKRTQAKIINISSGIARLPYPGLAVYGATKGFIISFSESLSCELADSNVSVLCFIPGFTHTPFIESSQMDMRKIPGFMIHRPEQTAKRIIKAIMQEKVLDYPDILTRFTTRLALLLPERFKLYLFRDLFWRLPDEK